MILRQFSPSLVTVLLITLVQVGNVSSSSGSSGSRTSRSKSKGKGLSSHVHTSGHQYGGGEESSSSLLMKPSKPDPHFEILAEQKAYKNYYPSKLREGRSRSIEVKRTTLKEAASSSSKKRCCERKAKSKGLASAASTNPAQYTFMKKRAEWEMMEEVEPTPPNPKFTGSQLISGDAGMSDDFKEERETSRVNSVRRDTGWKILMGPSVPPPGGDEQEEEDNYAYNNDNEDYAFSKRAFTSMTDGEARANNRNDNHRTITKLPQRGGGKSRGTLKYGSMDDFSNLKRVTEAISGTHEKGNRERGSSSSASQKSSRMRQVKVQASSIIPKQTLQHKYATITKRQPSKSSPPEVKQTKSGSSNRSGKKVRVSTGATSKVQYSTPIKSSTWEANHRRSHYSRGRGENEINGFNASPAMTLDTKKLMLEQMGSGEPPTISVYSGERPSSPSRFDRLENQDEDDEDLITEDDDGINDGHQPHSFQTKTALNVGEVYSPLISVSTALNYDPSRRTEQGGGIVTASSEDFPQLVHSPAVRNEQMEEHQDENGINDDDIVDAPPPTQLAYLIPPGSSNGRILVRPPPPSPSTTPVEGSFRPWGSGSASSSSGSLSPFRTVPPPTYASTPPDTFHFAAPNAPSELFPFRHDFLELSTGHYNPNPKFTAEKPHHHPQDSLSSHSHLHPHQHPLILPYPHQPPPHHPRFLPYPPPGLRKPIGIPIPVDLSSGRKAPPPGTFGEEPTAPQSYAHSPPPPPPPGVDPDHPAIQHALRNPHALLRDGIFLEQTSGSHIPETTKNYLKYEVHQNSLIPLDKRLVYLSMIFSWMFWITAFYTYYRYAINGHKTNHFTLNVPKDGENPQVIARALDTNNPWNFTKVLEYIEIAQKTYEGFDWQDLNCQKRTLCELVQKQQEPWGETGRKLANSNVYRVLDSLDGIPVPQVIQNYLKQYKEAVTQGRDPTNNCGQLYPQCKFSIKDVLNKAGRKKKA